MAAGYDKVRSHLSYLRSKLRKKGLLPPRKRSAEFLRHQPIREMILQGARMGEVYK